MSRAVKEYTKSVLVDAEISDIDRLLSDVGALPNWTTFFTSIGRLYKGKYFSTTIMGKGFTWIERQAKHLPYVYHICTEFEEITERAKLEVSACSASGFQVAFTLSLPAYLDGERVTTMLKTLEMELQTLKQLVEREAA